MCVISLVALCFFQFPVNRVTPGEVSDVSAVIWEGRTGPSKPAQLLRVPGCHKENMEEHFTMYEAQRPTERERVNRLVSPNSFA